MNIEKRQNLTYEAILKKISEFDIYRLVIGEDFTIGNALHSPVRSDNSPSFVVYLGSSGKLKHMDFANTAISGGPVDLVMQKHGIGYNESLEWISRMFGLGLGNDTKDTILYNKVKNSYATPVISEKKYTFIQVTTKKFTKESLRYWQDYLITETQLRSNDVYCVRELYLNRKRVPITKDELVFGYYYKNLNSWKILFPQREKAKKWLSNIPLSTIESLDNIRNKKFAVVTKSTKDRLVLSNILDCVCSVQNESKGALTKENIELINMFNRNVYLNLDNDLTGKTTSIEITTQYHWKWINVPNHLGERGIKDFSDWVKAEQSYTPVINYLKEKQIL